MFQTARGKNHESDNICSGWKTLSSSHRVRGAHGSGALQVQHPQYQRPAQTCPASTPPGPGRRGHWHHPRASWPKCLVLLNQHGSTHVLPTRQDLCRDCALSWGGRAPGCHAGCPPAPAPPGTPVSARDPDRTRVGMHRGAGAAPAAHQRADPQARQTLPKAPSHPALAVTAWGNPVIPRETHLQEAGGQCTPPAMRGKHQRDHTQARWLRKLALRPHPWPLSLPSAVLSGTRQK